ncbi:sugar ABC transporter permease [Lacticaseibacillus pabuli]|uniref:Maltose/maltodextrin transport system permease protein n=1 Tax=Lacticaseibacillus pabuli TaxID=3025672 RepID=A0ABY7WQ06_9LACO|nr:sugar ABC transporter permease [Lacticaseibacillus sp. KACC 23028]WDF82273.1 sugar ABC transporter permease [Lacticaseibacillus sp. KACC 23028]
MFKRKAKKPKEATYREVWQHGDLATKLSFFIMGFAQLKNKQWVKGLSFLITEVVFLIWMVFSGVSALSMLTTLGTIKHKQVVFDKTQGVYITKMPDNSVVILLFGVLAVILVIAMIGLYVANLRSVRHLYALKRDGEHVPTNGEDLASLLDKKLYGTLLAIPIAGVVAFTILPTVYMISMAFTNYDSKHPIGFSWTGFAAFKNVLSGDLAGTFFPVLGWTLVWAICATATTFFFGVLLAMLIESKGIKHKGFWRTIFVIVYAVPQFISLLMMAQFLDLQGPLNTLLLNWGWIAHPINFISASANPMVARITVIIVNMWIGVPVSMLVSTAIIQNLPQDQIEAARIDGANAFQIFRSVTFPQILFVMAPALIQQFIGNINNFNVIFLLTGGYPMNNNYNGAGDTDLLVTWLYNLVFGQTQRYNASAVLGILIFIISATVSLIAYRRTNAFKEG